MNSPFLQRLTSLICESPERSPESLPHVRPAFEDTLAVAYAGWGEPVTQKVKSLYAGQSAGGGDRAPEQPGPLEPETAALILGTAAHALDFDDVHQSSSTHPSAPIVAALVAAVQAEPELTGRMTTAFGVGLAANVGLGRVLGFSHYQKGWHATSTIGPMAAAAAAANLYGLKAEQAAHALALAAAQCGGLQRNFGAMAKPAQAGLAGAAGLRAARMARAGLTADEDVFAEKGYFDLYGGERLEEDPERIIFDIDGGGISVKLYPCCYMTHRPIAAALQAHQAMREKGLELERLAEIEVSAPPGSNLPLRVQDPRVGSEGKFCGAYTVACALHDGEVTLAHFEDDAVHRADIRQVMSRVRMVEREGKADGMKRRTSPVTLTARDGAGNTVLDTAVVPFPGSPDSPPTGAQLEAKVRDCLAHYERHMGNRIEYEGFQAFVDRLMAPAAGQRKTASAD